MTDSRQTWLESLDPRVRAEVEAEIATTTRIRTISNTLRMPTGSRLQTPGWG